MELYNVVFPAQIDLSLLPMAGRKVVDALTFWEPAISYPEEQDVLVYEHLPIVSIWLDKSQKKSLEAKGLEVELHQTAAIEPLSDDFAIDGTQAAFGAYDYPVRNDTLVKIKNPSSQVIGERKVYYYTNPDGVSVAENYGGIWSQQRIVGQPLLTPAMVEYGFTKAWAGGYRGQGLKVGIIDSYYENGWHPNLTIIEWKDFSRGANTSAANAAAHPQCVMTPLAAKWTRDGGIQGGIPDAQIYMAGPENMVASMEYFIGLGVSAVVIPYSGSFGGVLGVVIKKASDKGIGVFVSAGNNDYPSAINGLAANAGAIAVAGLDAGDFIKRTNSHGARFQQTEPYLNKWPMFAVDGVLLGCSHIPDRTMLPSPFQYNRGTSFSAPLVAAIFCIYKQKYPEMSLRGLLELMKLHGTPSANARVIIPTLTKIFP